MTSSPFIPRSTLTEGIAPLGKLLLLLLLTTAASLAATDTLHEDRWFSPM